jgi:hypothetical protein
MSGRQFSRLAEIRKMTISSRADTLATLKFPQKKTKKLSLFMADSEDAAAQGVQAAELTYESLSQTLKEAYPSAQSGVPSFDNALDAAVLVLSCCRKAEIAASRRGVTTDEVVDHACAILSLLRVPQDCRRILALRSVLKKVGKLVLVRHFGCRWVEKMSRPGSSSRPSGFTGMCVNMSQRE